MLEREARGSGSLVDHAVREVRAYIRDHDLKVGGALPGEGHFASALGVSRAVMREAFGQLAALRQLDIGNGRRARVCAIDGSVMAASLDHAVATDQISVGDVWDVRRTLELRTAALASRNGSTADGERILAAARAMSADGDSLERLTDHDITFHQAIARAGGNPLFAQIINSFEPLMRAAVAAAWQTRTTLEQRDVMLTRHHAIAEAIVHGDEEAAVAAMSLHFDTSIGDLFRGGSHFAPLSTAR